jgi:hypothetical protein
MSASHGKREWPSAELWAQLEHLEGRHQRVQSEYERARRGLESLTPREIEEVRSAWRRYCEVIAELDQTTSEFEALRG